MASVKRIVLWSAGLLVGLGVLALAFGMWWVSSLIQSDQSDPTSAAAEFGKVRAQFSGVAPAFAIRSDRLVIVRPAKEPTSNAAAAVHLLVWDPSPRTLSRVTLPFSLAAVATEPLPLEGLLGVANQGLGAVMEAKRRGNELGVRLSDLERYGRTLLLDGMTSDGKHVLMWSE